MELPLQLQERVLGLAVGGELGQPFLLLARTLAAISLTSRHWHAWCHNLALTVDLRRLGEEVLVAGRAELQHPRAAGRRAPVWAWLAQWRVRHLAWWEPGTAAWLFNRPAFQQRSGSTLQSATGLTCTADLELSPYTALETLELREASGTWWVEADGLQREALATLPRLRMLNLTNWPKVSLELPASLQELRVRTPPLPRTVQPFGTESSWRVEIDLALRPRLPISGAGSSQGIAGPAGAPGAHTIRLRVEPINAAQPARVGLSWAFLCRCCSDVHVSALDTELRLGSGPALSAADQAQVELERGPVQHLEFQQPQPEAFGRVVVSRGLRWQWSPDPEVPAQLAPDAGDVLRVLEQRCRGVAFTKPQPRTVVIEREPV